MHTVVGSPDVDGSFAYVTVGFLWFCQFFESSLAVPIFLSMTMA